MLRNCHLPSTSQELKTKTYFLLPTETVGQGSPSTQGLTPAALWGMVYVLLLWVLAVYMEVRSVCPGSLTGPAIQINNWHVARVLCTETDLQPGHLDTAGTHRFLLNRFLPNTSEATASVVASQKSQLNPKKWWLDLPCARPRVKASELKEGSLQEMRTS